LTKDALGELFIERLTQSGVDLSLSVAASEPATLAIATIKDSGQVHYDFYAAGTADWQWRWDELKKIDLRGAACVHAGSLGLVVEPGGPLLEQLLRSVRSHTTISIDPNVRTGLVDADIYHKKMSTWARLADILRLSNEDFTSIFPNSSFDSVSNQWHEMGTSLIILTRGPNSTVVSFNGVKFEVPTPSVQVVDTIGAGDAFNAGLLHWLHTTNNTGGRIGHLSAQDVYEAVTFAAHIAALSCAAPGANSPWASSLPQDVLTLLPQTAV
jgi:fructokinase